jgi:RNA polymerase sigma-70 factor (ECF subfamily)
MDMSVAMTMRQPAQHTIQLAQAGDDPARDELARYCRHTAYVFALAGCRDRLDAQDLAQETVLRVFTALDRLRADRPLRPWLLQIVRNLMRDRWRRRRVRRLEVPAGSPDVIPEPADPTSCPEAAAARRELQRTVWRAVSGLPARDREVLTLRDYLDLSYDEIAATLGIPRGTVMSRLHRARSHLREALTANGEAHHG